MYRRLESRDCLILLLSVCMGGSVAGGGMKAVVESGERGLIFWYSYILDI